MSLYPSSQSSKSKTNSNSKGDIFPARVKDILLSNEQPFFKETNGWGDIGIIKFKPLYKTIDIDSVITLTARPLFNNIQSLPLKEELVLIISAPSSDLNDNPNASEFYYFPYSLNIWNNNHNNAMPDVVTYDFKKEDLKLGNHFSEIEGIKKLLNEEGDVIIEGRFGNSIRFSSTGDSKNPWSSEGDKGKPITIFRNGQSNDPTSSPWTPIYEDINNDDSSIYMTSGQEIPLELSCKNLQSFNITVASSFNSSLQIPDSNSF